MSALNDPSLRKQTIYVGGIPEATDEAELLGLFSTFGDIIEIQIPTSQPTSQNPTPTGHRGFAFITFSVTSDAQDAIDNMDLNTIRGRVVKVNLAKAAKKTQWLHLETVPFGSRKIGFSKMPNRWPRVEEWVSERLQNLYRTRTWKNRGLDSNVYHVVITYHAFQPNSKIRAVDEHEHSRLVTESSLPPGISFSQLPSSN